MYLKQYPKGKYVALAKQRLQKLKDEAKQQAEVAEQNAWQTAESAQTGEAYSVYLNSYPKGRYAALAQTRADKLKREEAENEKREAAQRKQDEERQKLVAERERREADERARQEAARVAEEQRKAHEEAARGPQWADSDNGADINWNEAKAYCASKGSGWRLPTVAELEDSYKTGQPTPCGQWTCKVASKSRLTGPWFWSNEPKGSSEAWVVSLLTGSRYASPVETRNGTRALCVRRP